MNDAIAEILLLISAFATIVVMVLIIVKERRKQTAVDTNRAKNHAKRKSHAQSQGLYLD